MSLKDLIAKNRAKLQKGANNRTEKLQSGKNLVRILPSWTGKEDGELSQNWGQHFIKDTGGNLKAVYICTNTIFDEVCPICEAIGKGMAENHDEDILKSMKDSRSSKRILVNALYLKGGKNENAESVPVVLELPPSVFDQILAGAENFLEEGINVFDLNEGHNFIIEKSGTGMNTEYTVNPSPKASAVAKGVFDKVANLEDWARQESEADKMKALASVRGIAGTAEVNTTAPRLSAPTSNAATQRLSNVEVMDAEFDEVRPDLSGSKGVDDFLADLD